RPHLHVGAATAANRARYVRSSLAADDADGRNLAAARRAFFSPLEERRRLGGAALLREQARVGARIGARGRRSARQARTSAHAASRCGAQLHRGPRLARAPRALEEENRASGGGVVKGKITIA